MSNLKQQQSPEFLIQMLISCMHGAHSRTAHRRTLYISSVVHCGACDNFRRVIIQYRNSVEHKADNVCTLLVHIKSIVRFL